MYKNFIIAFCLSLFCHYALAETCPNTSQVKHSLLGEWKAYDSDDHNPLSPARETHFKKNVAHFALAEYMNVNGRDNAIHCYYTDKNGSDLEAYLAKTNFTLNGNKQFWYKVSGAMHCAAGMEKCTFKHMGLQQKQLAKR